MPRGGESFNKHKAAVEQRRADAQSQYGPKADYFGLLDRQFAAVRFLEQGTDIAWASMHRVPVAGSTYPQDVICLDQADDGTPCPFCQSEHKNIRTRSTKGFYNIIWRGNVAFQTVNQQILTNNAQLIAAGSPSQATYTLAPVYKRNEWNSPEKGPDGNKIILDFRDGVFLWKASKSVHDQIVSKDGTYGGLMSRDFVVRREGATKEDTKYYIEPLDVNSGAVQMSPEDLALATDENKYDLDAFITPLAFDVAQQMLYGLPTNEVPAVTGTFQRGGAMAPPPPVGMPPAPGVMPAGLPVPQTPTPFQQPAPGTMPPPPAVPQA